MRNRNIITLFSTLVLLLAMSMIISSILPSFTEYETETGKEDSNITEKPEIQQINLENIVASVRSLDIWDAEKLLPGYQVQGYLGATGESKLYFIEVPVHAIAMRAILKCPGADFDLYGCFGQYNEPAIDNYDWRGYRWGDEDETIENPTAGICYILVNSYWNKGNYQLFVEFYEEIRSDVPITGSFSNGESTTKMYVVEINDNVRYIDVDLEGSNNGIYCYGRFGAIPTTSWYDFHGRNGAIYYFPKANLCYIMIDSFYGYGSFELTVTLYGNYKSLSNGVPLPNEYIYDGQYKMYSINVGRDAQKLTIDLNGPSGSSTNFDLYCQIGCEATTGYYCDSAARDTSDELIVYFNPDPGTWYILVHSEKGSGYLDLEATVEYNPYKKILNDEPVWGYLGSAGQVDYYYLNVASGANSIRTVLECPGADFDVYGRFGLLPTLSEYHWRGYNWGDEDVTYNTPKSGICYIMVRSYWGRGSYELTVSVDYTINSGKYAILTGLTKWKIATSKLDFCDNDVTAWHNFLVSKQYECSIFGDQDPNCNYAKYDGRGRESTVKNAIRDTAAKAKAGDTVVIVHSGHGNGDYRGASYLDMWDSHNGDNGEDGFYTDVEFASDIGRFAIGVRVFVFFDACLSGGMGPELMELPNKLNIYCTTTCTEYGYGHPSHQVDYSCWVEYFLLKTLLEDPSWPMELTFDEGRDKYSWASPSDTPMEFDGNPSEEFFL